MRQAGGACELLEGNPQKLLVRYEKNSKYFTVRVMILIHIMILNAKKVTYKQDKPGGNIQMEDVK